MTLIFGDGLLVYLLACLCLCSVGLGLFVVSLLPFLAGLVVFVYWFCCLSCFAVCWFDYSGITFAMF